MQYAKVILEKMDRKEKFFKQIVQRKKEFFIQKHQRVHLEILPNL